MVMIYSYELFKYSDNIPNMKSDKWLYKFWGTVVQVYPLTIRDSTSKGICHENKVELLQ